MSKDIDLTKLTDRHTEVIESSPYPKQTPFKHAQLTAEVVMGLLKWIPKQSISFITEVTPEELFQAYLNTL